jgi:hypothetical protein
VKKYFVILALVAMFALITMGASGCNETDKSGDAVQTAQQEKLTSEATAQTGMPAIKNFRERKLLKDILELRDQDGLTTYTYVFAEQTGKLIFLGESVGYGIPYATQYTNPQKIADSWESGYAILPQADPNGLFAPASAEGTWVILKDPNSSKTSVVYIEPRIIVSPFKLNTD